MIIDKSQPGRFLSQIHGSLPVPCDHCGHPAEAKWQGETDSSGFEILCLCDTCGPKFEADCKLPSDGTCDWCGREASDLKLVKNYESYGNRQAVCGKCRARQYRAVDAAVDDTEIDPWQAAADFFANHGDLDDCLMIDDDEYYECDYIDLNPDAA